jgi:hypothetical protein
MVGISGTRKVIAFKVIILRDLGLLFGLNAIRRIRKSFDLVNGLNNMFGLFSGGVMSRHNLGITGRIRIYQVLF